MKRGLAAAAGRTSASQSGRHRLAWSGSNPSCQGSNFRDSIVMAQDTDPAADGAECDTGSVNLSVIRSEV